MTHRFSVLLSVYAKENPAYLGGSLASIIKQTRMPDEIVLVEDGPLGEALRKVVDEFASRYPSIVRVAKLGQNSGLGKALQFGLTQASHEIVARMDSDDIADPRRFEFQIGYMESHPECDVVGSNTIEFIDGPESPSGMRIVPETHEKILGTAKMKNPMNHMTVVFRKSAVLDAGGYQHVPYFEDYALWTRMLQLNSKFYNIQHPLVLARVGNDMIGKRHGTAYVGHEFRFFNTLRQSGFIDNGTFFANLALRLPLRLVPKSLLALLYKKILRKKKI
jgi:glycosyltransferase involved in cell wall biosynthesis